MNKSILFILLIIGIITSSIFYTMASYYFRIAEKKHIPFAHIFMISLLFGIISYSIKIPVYYFFGKNLSVFMINIFFLVITFIFVVCFSYFVLKEKIEKHTYIISFIVVCLLILNDILSLK
jgi:uncharacterized protein (DUF486 family)